MDEGTKQRIRTAGYNAGKVAGKLTKDQFALLQSFDEQYDTKALLLLLLLLLLLHCFSYY